MNLDSNKSANQKLDKTSYTDEIFGIKKEFPYPIFQKN